jgi:hypothetical protein
VPKRFRVCDRICRFLDKNTGMDDRERESRVARMLESVKPQLNRNQAAPFFSADTDGNEVQRDLYRVLMLLPQVVEGPPVNTFPMPPGWRDVLVKNAIAGISGETFHRLKKIIRPAKWSATALFHQIAGR